MKNKFVRRKFAEWLILCLVIFSLTSPPPSAQTVQPPFPVKREETPESWRRDGLNAIEQTKRNKIRKGKAKNVILFLGDGMGITTVTAARILEGQMRGESGEENRLSFEEFPNVALSKTYSANQQTPDSAPTMSAIVTGVKTDEGVLSVNQNVVRRDYKTVEPNKVETILEMAERAGKSTGVVTTARVTHATPAACYAHTAERDWESDTDILAKGKDAYAAKFPDIALQLLNFPYGDGLEVALGGGRSKFLPSGTSDPEYPNQKGERADGRDLTKEWTAKYKNAAYVWDKKSFDAVDAKRTKHLLGLFEPSHMQFEYDRKSKGAPNEPSLTEMTTKAIDILSQNKKGFFLMVEGGRIDQAHHYGNAYRALTDTIEFSNAVRAALSKVNLDETLIVVTADHSHSISMSEESARGNNILGLVRRLDENGNLASGYKVDALGLPFTTLNYANGRGYTGESNQQHEGEKRLLDAPEFNKPKSFKPITNGRPDLTEELVTNPDYLQEAVVPLGDEQHGGEDVGIFATGADSYLVHGVMEENWIFYVMREAMKLK